MAGITYKRAGVDISKGDEFVERIIPLARKLGRGGMLGSIGGFSGFCRIDKRRFREPVLVASTDGVGTKLLLTGGLKKYNTVGIDLVAMCANDVVVCGARPILFLDYFATGALELDKSVEIMKGIVEGCRQAGCPLLGGETAELPGLYRKGDYDLAGFCVGIVERKEIVDGSTVRAGDIILGVQSSGIHSNGFSLVRKIFAPKELRGWIGEIALTPTIIYVKPALAAMKRVKVKAMAHITGGGFYENIPRVIPSGMNAVINKYSWTVPAIFRLIQEKAGISLKEMFKTFNMGIGLVMVLDKKEAKKAQGVLRKFRLKSYIIGEVATGKGEVII
jgi:phosphoribosylformylglycinamidine cyclo-ligase